MRHILEGRIERRQRMIKTYDDLLAYWSGSRVIAYSIRLNQTKEFIQDQITNAKDKITEHTNQLSIYNQQIGVYNEMHQLASNKQQENHSIHEE